MFDAVHTLIVEKHSFACMCMPHIALHDEEHDQHSLEAGHHTKIEGGFQLPEYPRFIRELDVSTYQQKCSNRFKSNSLTFIYCI